MGHSQRRNDSVIYWPTFDDGGFTHPNAMTSPFEEIKVRYQDLQEKFIDLEGREDVSRAVIYSGKQLNRGGFIMNSNSVGPSFVEIYPPEVPTSLIEYLEYWAFDNNLSGANENDLAINSGNLAFTTGVAEQCIYNNDGIGYSIGSQSNLPIAGDEELTISLWIRSDLTELDTGSLSVLLSGNLDLVIDFGSANKITWGQGANISELSLDFGWAEEFVNVIVTWKKGEIQDIYLDAQLQVLDSQSIYDSVLIDSDLDVVTIVDEGNIFLDELRYYQSIIDDRDKQFIAAIHPMQYKEAFEIRQTYTTRNLRGSKTIFKNYLKSKD